MGHRDFAGHEVGRRHLQLQSEKVGYVLGPDDHQRLLRGADRDWQSGTALDLLESLHVLLPHIILELLVGLRTATQQEENQVVRRKIKAAQLMTVISWCTYPVVYLLPMLGISASTAVVGIQVGYCASDIISKCGVGLL